MVMDTPLQRSWRRRLARVRLRPYLARMSRVVVPGERAWQYARYLGVPEAKIRRAMYGIDYDALAPLHARRLAQPGGWPKRFLFTGRYVEEKGIDVLLDGYASYRKQSPAPFGLTCCGMGPMKNLLVGRDGVEDLGFVQPGDLPAVLARCGVFVLCSRFDPWPLVVVEACAAGLPVICTEACGSAVELVRTNYSGLTIATGDADAVARGLLWAERHYVDAPVMGARAQHFAAAYSAQAWADRWEHLLGELVQSSSHD
jgi:glycosyltransferase involved in cell wall biosynthesis